MQHYAAFHLGLHCLQKYSFRGVILICDLMKQYRVSASYVVGQFMITYSPDWTNPGSPFILLIVNLFRHPTLIKQGLYGANSLL